jgi:uncharacterized integral membrane protein (TIGR00697 family)
MVIIFSIIIRTPAPGFWEHQEAFRVVLGNTPRILFASSLAFVVGDFVNDRVFRRMKLRHPNSHKGFGGRAIISSFVGELVDSAIFLPIAFIGQMPAQTLLVMGIFQVSFKVVYELVILPVTYKVVKMVSRYENMGVI